VAAKTTFFCATDSIVLSVLSHSTEYTANFVSRLSCLLLVSA
jgi:hypothetical protein